MATAHWPAPSRVPLQPRVLADSGLCARHPDPGLWTSSRPLDRERATAICGWCPVLEVCREWALTLPQADGAIYAGLSAKQRRELRRAA
jgi:hypothetical protein